MGSGAEWAFESYLAYVPYKGVSHKQHKDAVKAAGGFFDWNLKKWVARTETALLSMIATRVWHPDGIARGDVDALVAYVQQRVQKGSVGERERATQQHAREHEKMARQERVREAEQDDKKKLKAAAVAARKRRDLGRPDDEPSLVAHCLDAYGILPGDLSLTAHFPELGPLSGLSDAACHTSILHRRRLHWKETLHACSNCRGKAASRSALSAGWCDTIVQDSEECCVSSPNRHYERISW